MAERAHHHAPRRIGFAPASAIVLAALLAGCASGPGRVGWGGGDGPPRNPPANLSQVPDAEPREETIRQSGGTSKPYSVAGRSYTPITDDRTFRESGLASWYGRQFHGQPTASGERYDMYAMTAAHKTLPLPSYVRVRNPANGRSAIVRVNDRGPFHDDRVIDLSYTAALQLDLLRGVAPVEIERITNADIRAGTWRRAGEVQLASGAAPAPASLATPVLNPLSAPRARPVLLAQAAPIAVSPSGAASDPVSDAAPPPRFGSMRSSDLPPLTPAAPESAPSAAGSSPEAASPPRGDAASAASEATPPPLPTGAARGFWLQLGAFGEPAAAQDLQARSTRSLPALGAPLRVFSEAGIHRLQAGPFATRAEADAAAQQVRGALNLSPFVVERR